MGSYAVLFDQADGFVDVCSVAEIPEKRAYVACLSGERVAVFRWVGLSVPVRGNSVTVIDTVCASCEHLRKSNALGVHPAFT